MKIKLNKNGYWIVVGEDGKRISPEFHSATEALDWRNIKRKAEMSING